MSFASRRKDWQRRQHQKWGLFFALPLAPCCSSPLALAHPQQHGEPHSPALGGCWLSRPAKNQEMHNFPALKKKQKNKPNIRNIQYQYSHQTETGNLRRGARAARFISQLLSPADSVQNERFCPLHCAGRAFAKAGSLFASLRAPHCPQHPTISLFPQSKARGIPH